MTITLGTNVAAYSTRTRLNNVIDGLANTMERLSTGLKINKAGDDSASLVISQNMEANVRGSRQAMSNIQNSKVYLTIAEDGMVSVGDHLQRINDLLVNMANDTNDNNSRTAAIMEIIERLSEINRLAESTNYNGRTMLDGNKDKDGNVQKIIVQMGENDSDLCTLDISPALTDCHVSTLGVLLPDNLNPDKGEEIFKPTNENCRDYMASIQSAISNLATRRGLLGAYENRLESAYDSMSTRVESLETAKSNYVDADIAEETTKLSQKQIMEQINVAILANANTLPQMALSLMS